MAFRRRRFRSFRGRRGFAGRRRRTHIVTGKRRRRKAIINSYLIQCIL